MGLLLEKSHGSNLVTSSLQIDQIGQLGNLRDVLDLVQIEVQVLKVDVWSETSAQLLHLLALKH